MKGITGAKTVEIPWWLRKPATTSVRKIEEQTEEKIVERTGVSIGGRTNERTVK